VSRGYVLTGRAQRDLRRIRDYIAEDSPRAAARFIANLIEEFERLAAFPLMAQAVASHPRFRRLPHGAYVIFYEIVQERVVIRSIEHSATVK
jgi:hypothetical protein